MPLLFEIINALENHAPLQYQENYDNSGLIVGERNKEISGAIICLDCIETVIDEAIEKQCQLVIAHHPIVFSGLKSLTGKNYIERVIIKAIKNDIAIYAMHTNLDNVSAGVNRKIAEKLQLSNLEILDAKMGTLKKLYVYVPAEYADTVRSALFAAGAGKIGEYSSCSYNIAGEGTFLPSEHADPFIGTAGMLQKEKETKIEVIITADKQHEVLRAMYKAHPYEEVAYGMISLENRNQYIGAGMTGELETDMEQEDFLKFLKRQMKTDCIRYTAFLHKSIRKVAVCGGSGSFLLHKAIQAGADVLVTADFKYHQFFDAESKILIADIGHYESEQFTGEIFYEVLSKKFPNFALHLTAINTNPIKYY